MFLGPLEGFLSLRKCFWFVSEPRVKWTILAQIMSLAQYFDISTNFQTTVDAREVLAHARNLQIYKIYIKGFQTH